MNCKKCKKDIPEGSLYCNWCGIKQVRERKNQRADGRLQKQITVTVNGEKKQKCFYGKTMAEINQKIINYQGEVEKGRTFKAVAEEWWEEHETTLESNSLKNYAPALRRAKEWLGNEYVKKITANDINLLIVKFAKKDYAQKTVTTQLQLIRQVLGYAVLCGEIEYNPATSVSIPKNLKKTNRDIPTEDEIKKIKGGTQASFGLFALFLLYTGCRRGEALAIQGKDIDLDRKEIHITKSVYYKSDKPFIKEPKTQAGIRTVPLLPQLEELLPKIKQEAYLFHFEDNLIRNKRFSTLWEKYCNETGVSITPHQLRHAYATRLYELGIDEKAAQELMGHADIMTTKNIYTHISDQKRKITAQQLAAF